MAKINITKPLGEKESYTLVNAFKVENQVYVIMDSERVGSMGLPIIYVSKYTNKLEKISDANEWAKVKDYLRGLINGTNFEFVKIDENINADEVYYTQLTLPVASFDILKNRYVLPEAKTNIVEEIAPVKAPEVESVSVNDLINEMAPSIAEEKVVEQSAPIMPSNVPLSNVEVNSTKIDATPVALEAPLPVVEEKVIEEQSAPVIANVVPKVEPESPREEMGSRVNVSNISFDAEKETFMKACENMFDALMGKYERRCADLEAREQAVIKKEQEIEAKLKNANEHLANAEAREQVANIAHDNAKRVMDISNLMPNNPNN